MDTVKTLTGVITAPTPGAPEYVFRHFEVAAEISLQFTQAESLEAKLGAVAQDLYNSFYPEAPFQEYPGAPIPSWVGGGVAIWQRLNSACPDIWAIEIPIQGEEKPLKMFLFEEGMFLLIFWPDGSVVPLSLK